jgi:cytochrome c
VSGSVDSFTYSDALKRAHITWDSESLDKWLAGPDKLIPESAMAFHVENADERSAIIAVKEVR